MSKISQMVPNNRNEMLDILDITDQVCAEVGVFKGKFSVEILKRNPKKLFLIDPWAHQDDKFYNSDKTNVNSKEFDRIFGNVTKGFSGDKRVEIVRKFSFDASRDFKDNHFYFIYIDAIHDFKNVLADMEAWFPKVRPGGWLCGHDFSGGWPEVKKAVGAFQGRHGLNLGLITIGKRSASWGIKKPEGYKFIQQ